MLLDKSYTYTLAMVVKKNDRPFFITEKKRTCHGRNFTILLHVETYARDNIYLVRTLYMFYAGLLSSGKMLWQNCYQAFSYNKAKN